MAAAPGDLAERTFIEMLEGWRNQQLARNLAFATINSREAEIRRFVSDAGEYPWQWTFQLVDEWLGDQRAVRHLRQSTIRSKAVSLRLFCDYIVDDAYGWGQECWDSFGTHPTQVCHEWITATHVQEAEGRAGLRAFTIEELQAFFDCANDMVVTTRERGRKAWLSGFRDATVLKVAYAWGLRGSHARRPGLRRQPARKRVRSLRRALRGPWQSHEGLGAEAAERPERVRAGPPNASKNGSPRSALRWRGARANCCGRPSVAAESARRASRSTSGRSVASWACRVS